MPEQTMPAKTGRDIILIDDARHPQWVAAANAFARRMGSTTYIILQVHQPDTRWFENNRLAVPQPEQLEAFARDGIVLLPTWHQVQMLAYNPNSFASIAVTTCSNEGVSRYAGRQVRLAKLGGSETDLIEQRLLATRVLHAFDALDADGLAALCEAAFLNDPEVASMHLRFDDLRTHHRPLWLEKLNAAWLKEKINLEKLASLNYR